MRNPENVLNSLRKHSTEKDYVYTRLYRNLFNEQLFLQAYQNIYANAGNMTVGTDGKTIDAMSIERINRIINSIKTESYQPQPVRRVYIPKKNGKLRALGIPSIDDKLVQEVLRMILESIYENSFEDNSHGFRPNKSCHTALRQVQNRFTRCKWFIEGDIKSFFDNIEHEILINILRQKIEDERFLNLIRKFLNTGYMEADKLYHNYSGTPQGGIISPLLANIYLDQFDKYVNEFKKQFEMGVKRKTFIPYRKLAEKRHTLVEKVKKSNNKNERTEILKAIKELDKEHKQMPCKNPMDREFKRLQYVRYADDFIIGIIGSKADAQLVKEHLTQFIRNKLDLELSTEKTLITKATNKARFLGYDIRVSPKSNLTRKTKRGIKARNYGGHVLLEVPTELIKKKLIELGAMYIDIQNNTEIWKPTHRGDLIARNDLSILDQYNGEIRGICNYYSIANNRSKLHKFRCIMEYSFYRTMACKYRTSVRKITQKYRIGKDMGVHYVSKKGEQKVRVLWKGSLAKDPYPKEQSVDIIRKPKGILKKPTLSNRLVGGKCEWCGKKTEKLVVHQVRSLKELNEEKEWDKFMKKINRKTLIVCKECHSKFHN